jgi:cytochrome c553
MNDMTTMTTACASCPHRKPLALLPAQRVDAPAPDMQAKAREGRLLALAAKAARRAAAFQPVQTILIDPDFRARVEAIAARRVVTANTVATARPLAAG